MSRTTRRRSVGGALGNALLNLAAIGGFVCIVLVILSVVFHISLIMFKTGSMSPTIPAGSVAVVREIPASEIAVGDVVTVDRPGKLPVTHRVTSVSGEGATRTITMQGDANDVPDPAPYEVTDVRRVLGSAPGLAYVIVWFSNPWVLGGLTICASALVTWAFWPRQPREPRGRHGQGTPAETGSGGGGLVGSGAALGLAGLACSLALALGNAAPAAADAPGDVQVIRGEHLTLTSIGDFAAMAVMRPGVPVAWQVGVALHSEEPGAVEVALAAEGARELGLSIDVRACAERWEGGRCAGDEIPVELDGLVDPGAGFRPLIEFQGNGERWILVTATVPEHAEGAVALTMRAAGSGDDLAVGPGPIRPLPTTGSGVGLEGAVLLGLGSVGAGLGIAGVARLVKHRRAGATS